MKYEVGDKVRVRKDLIAGSGYGEDIFLADMKKYSGKTMTVYKITSVGKYKLKEDINNYNWTDEMLEDVESINILVKGNVVIAKKGDKTGIAKCSPEDEFNVFVGARLAIDRLEEECKPYSWLKKDVKYYYPYIARTDLYASCRYANDGFDKMMISRGLVFKTKEEAIECAKKMLEVVK